MFAAANCQQGGRRTAMTAPGATRDPRLTRSRVPALPFSPNARTRRTSRRARSLGLTFLVSGIRSSRGCGRAAAAMRLGALHQASRLTEHCGDRAVAVSRRSRCRKARRFLRHGGISKHAVWRQVSKTPRRPGLESFLESGRGPAAHSESFLTMARRAWKMLVSLADLKSLHGIESIGKLQCFGRTVAVWPRIQRISTAAAMRDNWANGLKFAAANI